MMTDLQDNKMYSTIAYDKKVYIYFLYNSTRKLIYIGSSSDIYSRLRYHEIKYYFFKVLQTSKKDRWRDESYFIKKHWPKYNKSLPFIEKLKTTDEAIDYRWINNDTSIKKCIVARLQQEDPTLTSAAGIRFYDLDKINKIKECCRIEKNLKVTKKTDIDEKKLEMERDLSGGNLVLLDDFFKEHEDKKHLRSSVVIKIKPKKVYKIKQLNKLSKPARIYRLYSKTKVLSIVCA